MRYLSCILVMLALGGTDALADPPGAICLPPASDLDIFRPPWVSDARFRDWTCRRWEQAREYRKFACAMGQRWEGVAQRAREIETVWDTLDWAVMHGENEEGQRRLAGLRRALGPSYVFGWQAMPDLSELAMELD